MPTRPLKVPRPVGYRRPSSIALWLVFGLVACSSEPFDLPGERALPFCDLDTDLLVSSVPADAIPSLIEPDMVTIGHPGTQYLLDSDRVLGVVIDGQPRAYPHPVLDHHEVVSDRVGDRWVTVTFCPLTGSGLVVDPHLGGERLDIGVSGLLFANNLVLYDRTSGDVYGPQLLIEGSCGRFRDESLALLPVQEMSWGRWRVMYPNTVVVSSETGFDRDYRDSPYSAYRQIRNDDLVFEMDVDRTRPLKERVLAIRVGDGGPGYPFGELAEFGAPAAINDTVSGEPTVVFYEPDGGQAAIAFHARVGGQTLTFDAEGDGRWRDRETRTLWRLDGRAESGPLSGERLETREDAFVVYWFAWRHFQPAGELWAN